MNDENEFIGLLNKLIYALKCSAKSVK